MDATLLSMLKDIEHNVNYHLVREIASGGMGIVYEALQSGVGGFSKTVAIKLIREEFSNISSFRKNFVGEARIVANLIHTNIVQIYQLGETKGRYFMVQEFVNGVNLQDFLFQHQLLREQVPIEMAIFIVSRICRGLAYAHTKRDNKGTPLGIVHRDVSPKNIMIAYEGDVKLTDFGIAKAADLMYNEEGKIIAGRDEYLSPEQARRRVTDKRADLFSCGVILAELLLGYNCFEEEKPEKSRENILSKPIPDLSEIREGIDTELNAIVHKALQRNRRHRYQNANVMLLALESYLYKDGYGPTNEKLGDYLRNLNTRYKVAEEQLSCE